MIGKSPNPTFYPSRRTCCKTIKYTVWWMGLGTTNFSSFKRLMFVFHGIVYFSYFGLRGGSVSESYGFAQFVFGSSCYYFLS